MPASAATQEAVTVEQLLANHREMRAGHVWNVLDTRWWLKWRAYSGLEVPGEPTPERTAQQPPMVDNSGLLEDGGKRLKAGLVSGRDFVLVPHAVWTALIELYGGGPEIARTVIDDSGAVRVEVYPLRLLLFLPQMFTKRSPGTEVEISKVATVGDLRKIACDQMLPHYSQEALNLSLMLGTKRDCRLNNLFETLDDAHVFDGSSILIESSTMRLESPDPYSSDSDYEMLSLSGPSNSLVSRAPGTSAIAKPSRSAGLTGLYNLGNTCFMNSGLQCLSNTMALTKYFLDQSYLEEINRDNPLGAGGRMVEEYGALVNQMWSARHGEISPREFKHVLGKFAPQFTGFQQHDSQELLAHLLDALHEDLNRVKKKPYVETIESDGRPDAEVAAQAWEGHLRRNDSIIVDLFHGQFKSTLVCPECSKVSITFDPFMYLTLNLPSATTRVITVTVVRAGGHVRPTRYGVTVAKTAQLRAVVDEVSKLSGIDSQSLVLADIFAHKISRRLGDLSKSVDEIGDHDIIYAYEIEYPREVPEDDRCIITVVNGEADAHQLSYVKFVWHPLLLGAGRHSTTKDDIVRAILNHSKGFTASASDDEYDMCDDDALPATLPFELRTCNQYGYEIRDLAVDAAGVVSVERDMSVYCKWAPDALKRTEIEGAVDIHPSADPSKVDTANGTDVYTCLRNFVTAEQLGEDDLWYCPHCKEHRQATKKLDLWKLPKILVVHLKRFIYTHYWRDKIDMFVDFPLEGLNLGEFAIGPQDKGSLVYDLFAISNHMGGLGGGHYTAYARNATEGKWYNFDDSHVGEANEDHLVSPSSYVLFYQLREK